MYGSDYLAELFGVSQTTIRVHLRRLGYGVGMAGTYEFSESAIRTVERQLAEAMGRPLTFASGSTPDIGNDALAAMINTPSVSGYVETVGRTPTTRGQRVTTVLVENKRNILLIVLALLSAVLGVDLAL